MICDRKSICIKTCNYETYILWHGHTNYVIPLHIPLHVNVPDVIHHNFSLFKLKSRKICQTDFYEMDK